MISLTPALSQLWVAIERMQSRHIAVKLVYRVSNIGLGSLSPHPPSPNIELSSKDYFDPTSGLHREVVETISKNVIKDIIAMVATFSFTAHHWIRGRSVQLSLRCFTVEDYEG
jgi:hypothetical protein